MLLSESELGINDFESILDEAVFLTDNESEVKLPAIPVVENSRLGCAVVDVNDLDSIVEEYGCDYEGAFCAIAEQNDLDPDDLAVMVEDAAIIETPELVNYVPNIVVKPISEDSFEYCLVETCFEDWLDTGLDEEFDALFSIIDLSEAYKDMDNDAARIMAMAQGGDAKKVKTPKAVHMGSSKLDKKLKNAEDENDPLAIMQAGVSKKAVKAFKKEQKKKANKNSGNKALDIMRSAQVDNGGGEESANQTSQRGFFGRHYDSAKARAGQAYGSAKARAGQAYGWAKTNPGKAAAIGAVGAAGAVGLGLLYKRLKANKNNPSMKARILAAINRLKAKLTGRNQSKLQQVGSAIRNRF